MDHLAKRTITLRHLPIDSAPHSELTIRDLLLILRRRRKLVAIATAICFSLGIMACLLSTPKFEGKGVLEIQKTSADMLGLQSMMVGASDGPGDALNANLDLQTESEILQSDALALKVIQELDLDKTRDFQPSSNLLARTLGLLTYSGPPDEPGGNLEDSPQRRIYALKVFAAHLKVEPVAGTRLITVRYFHPDRKVAPAVVNELIRALKDYGFQTRYTATNESSAWLNGQLADLKKQAQDLQAKVVSLQRFSGVYSLGTDSQGRDQVYSATVDRLQQATTALMAATSNRIMKGAVYQTVKNGDPELISGLAGASLMGASPSVQSSFTLLQTLRSQQAALQAQLAQDSSKFGSDYPKLADERSSMQSVTKAISDEVARIGKRAANDFRASQDAERSLNSLYVERKAEAGVLNDKTIEYGIAKQEADSSRNLYEDLFKRLKEAGVIEGLRSSNIAVVEPGRVAAKPSKPNVPVYLGISLVGGLFVGVCGALFTESVDSKIQSFEQVEQLLDAPLLGVLPKFSKSARQRFPNGGATSSFNQSLNGVNGPATAFAEALRALRTELLHSRGPAPPKVILVTSSVPGEGKTTVSANLAALLARSGKQVLLVEADMRNPSLSLGLNSPKESPNGLGVLLTDGERTLEEVAIEGVSGMRVLRAGPIPAFPAELLDSKRMRSLLENWSLQFDHIVLDSPPLLAVTDAAVLSHMADVTLLIARPGFTSSKALRRAYKLIEQNKETQVGVVLNAVDRKSASYCDYYGYSGSTHLVHKKERLHA
ncbi:MAG TPA: polysaccharide biosynthesis tyrosine autokinase [Terriglobales bacterium]|jgi:succinoglycan biosynthesis transport protein ExoP|nr:polysaccharide biosynthesis tyrosine autokinase [Terriglobales bacterium]